MPDCSSARIKIGGRLHEREFDELAELVNRYRLSDDEETNDIRDYLDGCAAKGVTLSLSASEVPGGQFEELETFCRKFGLSYVRADDGHYTWSPAVVYWTPELDEGREWPGVPDVNLPLLSAAEIRIHLADGTLDEELALMTAVHAFAVPFQALA